mmetsp:Transcript_4775/g.7146  ORF Transcript_4775/g.7146 Transcript_4775/m.7146 type:complete len:334 (-) Transcript_4775:193-1194(-)|eukprot:CAMPEP_0113944172 /NCGR_PEP_ID=MMETSP1339-20121228/30679_1 /TAXON_ID=94617 /ORGANISM="Fibrocapsa japonica" /LENGTH=333 /DNA_ID=CAMNT_0000949259 /DNA_START=42 /DNA_END=1046 /DNA_ORIENTATION=+ /assembly_acc=CAM_ASM_000762
MEATPKVDFPIPSPTIPYFVITVGQADRVAKIGGGPCDVYFTLEYNGLEARTTIKQDCERDYWNEEFTVAAKTGYQAGNDILTVKAWDRGLNSSDDLIGVGVLSVSSKKYVGWLSLHAPSEDTSNLTDLVSAELNISVELVDPNASKSCFNFLSAFFGDSKSCFDPSNEKASGRTDGDALAPAAPAATKDVANEPSLEGLWEKTGHENFDTYMSEVLGVPPSLASKAANTRMRQGIRLQGNLAIFDIVGKKEVQVELVIGGPAVAGMIGGKSCQDRMVWGGEDNKSLVLYRTFDWDVTITRRLAPGGQQMIMETVASKDGKTITATQRYQRII